MKSARKPGGFKVFLRPFLKIALPAFVAALVMLYLLRGVFIEPFLKSYLVATVREKLGPAIEIGDITGNYLTGIGLREVRTTGSGTTGPLSSLDLERLTVGYSLFSLLGGLDSFLKRLEVDLAGAAVTLDLTRGKKDGSGSPQETIPLPGTLPTVRISRSSLSLAAEGYGVDAAGISLAVSGSAPAAIRATAERVDVRHPALGKSVFALDAGLTYRPEELVIDEILLDGTRLVDGGRLTLTGLPADFSFTLEALLFGGTLGLDGESKNGIVSLAAEAKRLDIASAARIFPLGEPAPGGILSFQSSLRLDSGKPFGVEGEAALSLEKGSLGEKSVEELRAAGGLHGGTLEIGTLEARAGETLLSFRDGRLPLGRIVAGEWQGLLREARASASLDSSDLPSFLALWGVAVPVPQKGVPAHRIRLEGNLAEGQLHIPSGGLETEGGRLQLQRADVLFPAPGESWGETGLTIDGDMDLEDAGFLTGILPLPPLGGAVRGRVRLDGAVTAPRGVVEVEAAGFAFAGRSLGDVSLAAEGDRERIVVRRAELRQGEGNRLFVEALAVPARELLSGQAPRILRALSGEAGLHLEDVPAFLESLGVDRKPAAVDATEHLLDFKGRLDGGSLVISSGKLQTPRGVVAVEDGRASLPAEGGDLLETRIDVGLTADLPDLRVLQELFAAPPLGGQLKGAARVRGPLDSLQGTVEAQIGALSYGEISFGDASLEGTAGGGMLTIASLEVRNGDDRITASGSFRIAERRLDGVDLEFQVGEIADYTAGLVPDKWLPRGRVSGKLQAEGPLSSPEVSLESDFRDGAVGGMAVAGASVSLKASEGTVLLRRLEAETGLGALSLEGDTRIAFGAETGVTIESATVQAPPGIFRVGGSIGPGDALALAVDAEGLSGEGWLEEIVGDRLSFAGADLALRVEGSLGQPRLTAAGTISEVRGKNAPGRLSGAFDLAYGGGSIQVHTLSLTGDGGRLEAAGSIPLADTDEAPAGPIDMTVALDIPDLGTFAMLVPEGYAPRGVLRGEVLMGGSPTDPEGQVFLEAADLFLPEELKGAPPGPFTVNVNGSWKGDGVLVDRLDVESEALTVKGAGSWKGAPAPGGILRGEKTRFAGDIALEAELDTPDLSWIAGVVPAFRRTGGSVAGKLKAAGPITDPDVSASFQIGDGEVSFKGFPLLSDLDGSLTFAGKSLSLKDITAEIGGSPTKLEGSLSFGDDWEPAFDLHLKGERLLLFRSEGMRVRADTEMSLAGPLSKLAVAGTIGIVDSQFVRNIDFLGSLGGQKRPPIEGKGMLFSFPDPPLRDMTFDIAVKAIEPFRIRNQYLSGSVRPNVVLKGTGEAPLLVGKVVIDPSRMYIPAGVLRTEGGELSFLERAPDRIWVDLDSSTRIMGYDIVMGVQGFADDPRITFTSLPPLPKDELLLLVMLGTPPASSDREVSQSAGGALAAFLGRGFLGRFFGSGEGTEEMILDRFETTIGRDITEAGKPTVDSTFRLYDGLLWKGDTLYLTGEKDRYDDVNYGVRLSVELGHGDDADE